MRTIQKKNILILTLSLGLFLITSVSITAFNLSDNTVGTTINEKKIEPVKGIISEALYLDQSSSLKELKSLSEEIVKGKVIKQEYYGALSLLSTISVEKAFKGDNKSEIQVIQLRDGNELSLNQEYILFLGKQTDNSGMFFVKGGYQGKFLNNKGQLESKDNKLQEDFEKIVKENNSSKSDIEKFSSFLDEK